MNATERSRTSTGLPPLAPEASASANSATVAFESRVAYANAASAKSFDKRLKIDANRRTGKRKE